MAKSGWYKESARHSLAAKGVPTVTKFPHTVIRTNISKKQVELAESYLDTYVQEISDDPQSMVKETGIKAKLTAEESEQISDNIRFDSSDVMSLAKIMQENNVTDDEGMHYNIGVRTWFSDFTQRKLVNMFIPELKR